MALLLSASLLSLVVFELLANCLFNVCEFTEYGLVDVNASFVKFDENGDPYYLKSIVKTLHPF